MRNNGYTSRLFNSSRSMLLCLSFIICHLSFSPAGAQELEAKITINHSKVQGSDASVFDNLQQTLEQFVNERQWTELQFQKNERIVCNFNITVDKYVQAENRFECSAIIQANRPVYNSAYTTTIYNNTDQNPYNLSCPSQVLLIEKDSLTSFFEHRKIVNFKDTYLCSYSSTTNGYTFGNIGSLVSHLYSKMQSGLKSDPAWLEHNPDWNKVLLVPVTSTQYTDTYGYSHYSSVTNDITLSSCRLVGGKDALTLSVIYSRFR